MMWIIAHKRGTTDYAYLEKVRHPTIKSKYQGKLYRFIRYGERGGALTRVFMLDHEGKIPENVETAIRSVGNYYVKYFHTKTEYTNYKKERNLHIPNMYIYENDRYRINIKSRWNPIPYLVLQDNENNFWYVELHFRKVFSVGLYEETRMYPRFVNYTSGQGTAMASHTINCYYTVEDMFASRAPIGIKLEKAWQYLDSKDMFKKVEEK